MRVTSFDIFDTLLTRMVALPIDLFRIIGAELHARALTSLTPPEFAAARVAAENKARLPHAHQETTFAEIYDTLAAALKWDPAQRDLAAQIELAAERQHLRPSELARRKLHAARLESDRILFVSDMYLPRAFLIEVLSEHGFWQHGDELYISGETKCSKALGTLFPHIREKISGIKSWRHYGDNEHSDIRMAARHGLDTEHVPHCFLTRYEKRFRPPAEPDVPLWRSKAAASLRYARLSAPDSNPHLESIWNIADSVAGPLLFGYVAWLLNDAAQRGVQRLYFISRDGEILLKMARQFIAHWNLPIEARYLYGSRQAWRPAAAETMDDWFKSWALATHTPTNLESIFSRLRLDPENFHDVLTAGGFPRERWTQPLPDVERDRLWELARHSEIARAIIARRASQRQLARDYLAQEGFADDLPMAIVDIGWFGSMHLCLDSIIGDLPARQARPLLGYYFGMISNPDAARMFAYWSEKPGYRPLPKTNFSFFERFAMAVHGSVTGYKSNGSKIHPQLECDRHEGLQNWGVETWQAAILKVTQILLETLSRAETLERDLFFITRENFDQFCAEPTLEEATDFGKLPQDQRNEILAPTVVPNLSEWEILRAVLDHRRRLPGWWPEGTMVVKRSPTLFLYLKLRRALGK
jgi:FMN phosphatase YigB (HAD superfamily)